jgi:hypothetical protein
MKTDVGLNLVRSEALNFLLGRFQHDRNVFLFLIAIFIIRDLLVEAGTPLFGQIGKGLDPKRAVERPVLNRFAHVLRRYFSLAIEIGDRTRNFQDPIVSSGA